jgi:hypothetical protein
MTRGRHSNDVFVVTDGSRSGRDILNEALNQDWIDTPATVRRAERPVPQRPREQTLVRPLPGGEIRRLLETEHHLARAITRHDFERSEVQRRLQQVEPAHGREVAELNGDRQRLAAAQAVLDRHDRFPPAE